MKKILFTLTGSIALLLMTAVAAMSAPITYYDLDFEDGTFGGGFVFPGYASPTNISPSSLDGRALAFALVPGFPHGTQLQWDINGPDSITQMVSFDYFAEPGANVTQFLDIPSILRLDVRATGRHHVAVYYDLSAQTAVAYLDGVLDPSLMTILAWPVNPTTVSIRIANQIDGPGNSTGYFEIDNLLWQGNVSLPVPEPASLLLLASGLMGAAFLRWRVGR